MPDVSVTLSVKAMASLRGGHEGLNDGLAAGATNDSTCIGGAALAALN
jgi:hypothetical protein